MVQVATHPDVTLLALELALHTWHTIACVPSASKMPPRELAQYELNYLYNPIRLSRDSFYVNQYLFFAALHAAGLVSDLNLGCSLAQSNGVVVLSLSPMPVLVAMSLEKWKTALTDAAKAAL
jgi:hypothetical protein